MSTRRSKQSYSPEFRAEAARQVIEQTSGNWVKAYRSEHGEDEPALSVPERIRLREAERELRELRLENEFLKKAAAYFAKERL